MTRKMFSRREFLILSVIALAGILSFLTEFDYFLAETLSSRTSIGVSLFFSYQYYIAFEVTALITLFLKNKRAAAAMVASTIALFLMQAAFTEYAPRERPPQAMSLGEGLMAVIRSTGTSSSFFSGHTASSVAAYTVFGIIDCHPTLMLLLILPIISSRITLVQHYFSDVVGGIVFGYVTTKIICSIMYVKDGRCDDKRHTL